MQEPVNQTDALAKRKQRFQRLEHLRLPWIQQSSGLASGVHRSMFKGHGVEFSELREYVPGDDIRSIDWKVTARLGQPFTRLFSEERDVTVCFAIDISRSTECGSCASKGEIAREIAGALMISALRQHDAVGLLLFSDRVEVYIPPRKGRHHVLDVVNTLFEYNTASRKTDIIPALRYLSGTLIRQSSVVIISDFFAPAFDRELGVLRKKHQVFAIRVTDPKEAEIRDVGLITLEDSETGEQAVADTSDPALRERFGEISRQYSTQIRRTFAERNIPVTTVPTDGRWERHLRRFFRGA